MDDLVHVDNDADWLARDLRLSLAKGRASIENEAKLADGTTFWAHMTRTPMRDARGDVSCFVVVLLYRPANSMPIVCSEAGTGRICLELYR